MAAKTTFKAPPILSNPLTSLEPVKSTKLSNAVGFLIGAASGVCYSLTGITGAMIPIYYKIPFVFTTIIGSAASGLTGFVMTGTLTLESRYGCCKRNIYSALQAGTFIGAAASIILTIPILNNLEYTNNSTPINRSESLILAISTAVFNIIGTLAAQKQVKNIIREKEEAAAGISKV